LGTHALYRYLIIKWAIRQKTRDNSCASFYGNILGEK
jgi:hypothetical protein